MIATHQTTVTFTPAVCGSLRSLRTEVSQAIAWPLEIHFDSTDSEAWATIYLEEIPRGQEADPGPLCSIVTGGEIAGPFAVLDGYGDLVLDGLELAQALQLGAYVCRREIAQHVDMADGKVWVSRAPLHLLAA